MVYTTKLKRIGASVAAKAGPLALEINTGWDAHHGINGWSIGGLTITRLYTPHWNT